MNAIKILDTAQIREADASTIANEPISSVDLMERAAGNLYKRIKNRLKPDLQICIFCGTGNNGGDGLVLARLMHNDGFKAVVYILRSGNSESKDFTINLLRYSEQGGTIHEITASNHLPFIPDNALVVDALFGSGLNRTLDGLAAGLVRHINQSGATVVSVDMPSGLFADRPMPRNESVVIHADYTYTFELPKLAFLMPENEFFVGDWEVVPIGLDAGFIAGAATRNFLVTADWLRGMLKGRRRHAHKGDFGHALLIAGSSGKGGAALLAAEACLRSGAGLLHVHLPQSLQSALLSRLPEAMISREEADYFSHLPDIAQYNAIGIGPGLGTANETTTALKLLIQQARVPMVLDADALNILAENPTWMAFLPKGSILTPHPGEFRRLAGHWNDSYEKLEMQRQLSLKHGLIIVVKGAYSCVSLPDGRCYFNNTGNPGMATGGSGDVLTGIITGLLARGYTPEEAALLGVWLHGMSGDIAAAKLGYESLIAGDIIAHLGQAFRMLAGDEFSQP